MRGSFVILSICFLTDVWALENSKTEVREQKSKQIKVLYKQAIADYKHDRLRESQKSFKKILSLDASHRKATYFLEHKIPRKLVEREAKKQENLRVEQIKAAYLQKKQLRQSAHESAEKHKSHVDDARSLFANEND